MSVDAVDADTSLSETFAELRYLNRRVSASNCSPATGCISGNFRFDLRDTFTVATDTAHDVLMDVRGHGQAASLGDPNSSYSYHSTAFLDPIIIVDPDFENADQCRVAFSSGITVIPLPAAWLLFVPAIAVLGAFRMMRRRLRLPSR